MILSFKRCYINLGGLRVLSIDYTNSTVYGPKGKGLPCHTSVNFFMLSISGYMWEKIFHIAQPQS